MSKQIVDNLSTYIMTKLPDFNRLMLYVPRVYVDTNDYFVQTDGKILKIGNRVIHEQNLSHKVYYILHGLLHVALQHPLRCREIAHDTSRLKLWNMATDCIVNLVLKDWKNSIFTIPSNAYTIHSLKSVLPSITDNYKWTAESIYNHLLKAQEKLENMTDTALLDLFPSEYPESNQTLISSGLNSETKSTEVQSIIWAERLHSMSKGNSSGSELKKLIGANIRPNIPWYQQLRNYLVDNVSSNNSRPDYKRMSRKCLNDLIDYYEPARGKEKGIKNLVILLDVSGSCWDNDIFNKFIANIDPIKSVANCQITIITFDIKVHNVLEVPSYLSLQQFMATTSIKLTGGGGTSFVPCLTEAAKYKPSLCIILTDCYGDFPSHPPSFNCLWVSIGATAPFGINIKAS